MEECETKFIAQVLKTTLTERIQRRRKYQDRSQWQVN